MWYLNPALTRFRGEVNERWPNRDKRSDGTIGDAAHQATNSDHNQDADGSVDAWDMDIDGVPVDKVIAAAIAHESIQYVIYNRRITSRSWGLGTWRPYTGTSPHTEHVHFNTRQSHERSTKPWFTTEVAEMADVTLTEGAIADIGNHVAAVLNQRFGFPVVPFGGTPPIDWHEVGQAVLAAPSAAVIADAVWNHAPTYNTMSAPAIADALRVSLGDDLAQEVARLITSG